MIFYRISLALIYSLGLCVIAWGQPPMMEREQLREEGELKNVGPGFLQIATKEGTMWRVALPRDGRLHFLADADTAILKPGMNVQVSASVNKKGQVTSEIGLVNVITPRAATDLGVQSEAGGENVAKNLFGDAKEEPKKGPKKDVDTPVRIGGTIVSIKKNVMVVSAGGAAFKCELAANCKVTLDIADLSLARIGDKVSVQGWYYAATRPNAMGSEVTVTAAKPLVDEKKKASESKSEAKTSEPKSAEADKKE